MIFDRFEGSWKVFWGSWGVLGSILGGLGKRALRRRSECALLEPSLGSFWRYVGVMRASRGVS